MYLANKTFRSVNKMWLATWLACICIEGMATLAASFHLLFLTAPNTLQHMGNDGQTGLSVVAILTFLCIAAVMQEQQRRCITRF